MIIKFLTITILISVMELDIHLQPKQYECMAAVQSGQYQNLLYGGAKFGGKSFLVRAKEITRRLGYPGTTGVIIRRTHPELLANHIRKFFLEYPQTKQWYRAGEKAIHYPTGSITEFKHLSNTQDVYDYQGLEYDDITLDEATQHDGEVIRVLRTSLRIDPKVKARNPIFRPCFFLTGNPGGIGHSEVKRLFIDRKFKTGEDKEDYYFLQAKIFDNPLGMKANPDYLNTLLALPDDFRRAYLEGDWTVFIGQFFKDFRKDIHGIDPVEIPDEWGKMFSLDWGYFPHPFHVGWYAQDFEGNVYKYRELEGVETPPDEVGGMIGELSKEDQGLCYGVGDTQMWALNPFSRSKGEMVSDKSIATMVNSTLAKRKMVMLKANKARIPGWTHLRSMLKWEGGHDDSGRRHFTREPKYRIFNTCPLTLSSYERQVHSSLRPEDMLKQDGDDPCDTDRYALMYIREGKLPEKEKKPEPKKDSHLRAFEEAEEGRSTSIFQVLKDI